MNALTMMDSLALEVEDSKGKTFGPWYKRMTLELAQLQVAHALHPRHLSNLALTQDEFELTTGISPAMTPANLTGRYTVLRGKDGIAQVKVTASGRYMVVIDFKDIKSLDNSILAGSLTSPRGYLFMNRLYAVPTTIAAVDLSYYRLPAPLLAVYTAAANGSATSVLSDDAKLAGTITGQFNTKCYLWNITQGVYYIPSAYTWSDNMGTFTINTTAAVPAQNDTFYICGGDHETLNLNSVTCELSANLHSLVVLVAASICFRRVGNKNRRNELLGEAYNQIRSLNEKALASAANAA